MRKSCFESQASIVGHGLFLAGDVKSYTVFFFLNNLVSSGFTGEIF